jgi:hypothetical protein
MARILLRIVLSLLIIVGLDLLTGLFMIPDSFNAFRSKHYYYHHGLLPMQETMAAWGALVYPLHTNSMGLVDSAAYRLEKETEQHRIMVLGDSHSEGVGVPYARTFSGRLATRLAPHNIHVINASAVSYSQKIEYLKARYLMEQKGLEVDEILVMIDISDLQNELVYEAFEAKEKSGLGDLFYRVKSRMKRISTITYLVDVVRTARQQEKFYNSIENFYADVRENENNNIWDLYSGFFSHFDNEVLLSNPQFHGMGGWMDDDNFRELALRGIALGQENMLKLKALCDERNIKLTLSVHPWHHQIEKGEIRDEYVKAWENFAVEHNIPFLSFFPLFVNNGEEPDVVIKKYYIKNDNHWNEFGHQKVADFLAGYFLN